MAPSDANNLIYLSDDDDDLPFIPPTASGSNAVLDDSCTDEELEELSETQFQRRIERAKIEASGSEPAATPYECRYLRNTTPAPPRAYVETCKWSGTTLSVGTTVEFGSDRNFLEICHIVQDLITDEVTLRGLFYKRNTRMGPLLIHHRNEVCMVLQVDADDDRPYAVQGMIDVPIEQVKRKRRLQRTHLDFPVLTTRELDAQNLPDKEYGRLVCRWVYVIIHETANAREKGTKSVEGILRRLTEQESKRVGMKAEQTATTASPPTSQGSNTRPRLPVKKMSLTFADVFSGGGGASRAAKMAGLRIKFAVDSDLTACRTYMLNFGRANVFHMDAGDVHALTENLYIDILHQSPPCQPWSPAHTRPGKNDEPNEAIMFAVEKIIEKVKPRLVTMEETFGLFSHHENTFCRLLGMIRGQGYDVRYKVVNFAEYGLCQKRKRLIIFASRRGIPLPEFPKPTHGEPGTGLRSFTSVHEALHSISPTATRDDDSRLKLPPGLAYNARTHMLAACITCSGGGNLHPSGLRTFTSREFARLQGFPDVHDFVGTMTAVTRQIGNAVPPSAFALFLTECRKTLEAVDQGTAILANIFEPRPKRDSSASTTPISTPLGSDTMSASSGQVTPESSQQSSRPTKSVTDPRGKRKAVEQPDIIELD